VQYVSRMLPCQYSYSGLARDAVLTGPYDGTRLPLSYARLCTYTFCTFSSGEKARSSCSSSSCMTICRIPLSALISYACW